MTELDATDVYVTALPVHAIFADPTYQRACDESRARKLAKEWDRRLVGIVEVSDRGEDVAPRYAIVDGQHRWAAAGRLDDPPALVANVHTGLSVAEEAELFDKLNRQRKQTNTWDHWKARRAAGEAAVLDIEATVAAHDLIVDMSPQDGRIACVSTLEKVVKLGGLRLLQQTLHLIVEMWGGRREALDSQIIHGLALVLWYLEEPLDHNRLAEVMLETTPRQLKANANQLREITTGNGSVRTAIALIASYNKMPGRRILVSNRTFSGKRREASAP